MIWYVDHVLISVQNKDIVENNRNYKRTSVSGKCMKLCKKGLMINSSLSTDE